ncbi:MAG: hypothetical protein NVSMB68_04620 [Thermoanaerobaculia bacterium]
MTRSHKTCNRPGAMVRAVPFMLLIILTTTMHAQQTVPGGVASPQPPSAAAAPGVEKETPFHLELGTFYSSLSNGYGDWRGADMRLFYTTRRATPILQISRQSHAGASQWNFGLASYITLNDRYYAIVGASQAPDRGTVLYPRTRLDAAILGNVAAVRGLVLSGGVTDIHGTTARSGGTIYSAGSLLYRGRAISSAVLRLNRDRRSGQRSYSEQVGMQYGEQGRYWVGASFTHGTEAYQIGGVIPFDVRFEGVGASAFAQRWVTRKQGFAVRYDYEHKYTAFVRAGGAITYFVDF